MHCSICRYLQTNKPDLFAQTECVQCNFRTTTALIKISGKNENLLLFCILFSTDVATIFIIYVLITTRKCSQIILYSIIFKKTNKHCFQIIFSCSPSTEKQLADSKRTATVLGRKNPFKYFCYWCFSKFNLLSCWYLHSFDFFSRKQDVREIISIYSYPPIDTTILFF